MKVVFTKSLLFIFMNYDGIVVIESLSEVYMNNNLSMGAKTTDKVCIKAEKVSYIYHGHNSHNQVKAVSDVSIKINKGEFVTILGRNGSGKSTFARLCNALLIPHSGVICVHGLDTSKQDNVWEIRRLAGMVFQNPDNQIVATIVEEDVAFGPENLGIEPDEIRNRVEDALRIVGMTEYANHAPHRLSGGQKQRVAIAGILAMKPECIILDEATAMLDPVGRREVMNVIKRLNRNEKITIVNITHHMDEAVYSDRVIIFDKGCIALEGHPSEVFSNVSKIKGLGLDVPQVTELFFRLNQLGYDVPLDVLTVEQAAIYLREYSSN